MGRFNSNAAEHTSRVRRLYIAKVLASPFTTVLAAVLSIVATFVLSIGSEQGNSAWTTWLAIDSVIAGFCMCYGSLGWAAGTPELWDGLVSLVAVLNLVLTALSPTFRNETSYANFFTLGSSVGSGICMVWVTEELLLFRRARFKEIVEQLESTLTAEADVAAPATVAQWGQRRSGLALSDMAALSPRTAGGMASMPSLAMTGRQASLSALPASARTNTTAFVPSMGSTIRRSLQLVLRVSIAALAVAQATGAFIAQVSPLSRAAQRIIFTCVALLLLVAVTHVVMRRSLHRKVVQPVVALAGLIERLGAMPMPPTEAEEKMSNTDAEGGRDSHGGDRERAGSSMGSAIVHRTVGGKKPPKPTITRRTLRRSYSNTETFVDVVMATLPAPVRNWIRRVAAVACNCRRASKAVTDARRAFNACGRRLGLRFRRRKANMSAAPVSLIASDNTYRVRETEVLRAYVRRMWKLVRLGFGDAGQRLVSTAIDLEGEWKDASSGTKVDAVFGFCDVRSFTDLTECLQEEVLPFVNDLARVVHGDVHASGGAPNKNIGDAFLLVWKLPETPLQNAAAVLHQQRAKTAAVAEATGLEISSTASVEDTRAKPIMPTASKRGSVVEWMRNSVKGVLSGTVAQPGGSSDSHAGSGDKGSSSGSAEKDKDRSRTSSRAEVDASSRRSFSASLKTLFRRASGAGTGPGMTSPAATMIGAASASSIGGAGTFVSPPASQGASATLFSSKGSVTSGRTDGPDGGRRQSYPTLMIATGADGRPAPPPIFAKLASVAIDGPDGHGSGEIEPPPVLQTTVAVAAAESPVDTVVQVVAATAGAEADDNKDKTALGGRSMESTDVTRGVLPGPDGPSVMHQSSSNGSLPGAVPGSPMANESVGTYASFAESHDDGQQQQQRQQPQLVPVQDASACQDARPVLEVPGAVSREPQGPFSSELSLASPPTLRQTPVDGHQDQQGQQHAGAATQSSTSPRDDPVHFVRLVEAHEGGPSEGGQPSLGLPSSTGRRASFSRNLAALDQEPLLVPSLQTTRVYNGGQASVGLQGPPSAEPTRAALIAEVAVRRRETMHGIGPLVSTRFPSTANNASALVLATGGLPSVGRPGFSSSIAVVEAYPPTGPSNAQRRRSGATGPGLGIVSPPQLLPAPAVTHGRLSSARSLQFEGGSDLAEPLHAPTAGGVLPNEYRQLAGVSLLATNALSAFMNIIIKIHAANMPGGALFSYRMHPRVKASHLWHEDPTSPDFEPFRIRAGFGLHIGWAVEGAIGSSIKVDASYLSPSVNVTARLESATRFYGVDLLMSKAFAQCLSYEVVGMLRRIDRVRLKGVAEPMELYTFDWDPRCGLELLVGKATARSLEREDYRQAYGLVNGQDPMASPGYNAAGGFGPAPGPWRSAEASAPVVPKGQRRSSAAHAFARPVHMLMQSVSLTSVTQGIAGMPDPGPAPGQPGYHALPPPMPGPMGSWIARQPTMAGSALFAAQNTARQDDDRDEDTIGKSNSTKAGWMKKVMGQSRRWLGVEAAMSSPTGSLHALHNNGKSPATPFLSPGVNEWIAASAAHTTGAYNAARGSAGRKGGIRYVQPSSNAGVSATLGMAGLGLPMANLGAYGLYATAEEQASDLRSLQRDAAGSEDEETQMSPFTGAAARSWLSVAGGQEVDSMSPGSQPHNATPHEGKDHKGSHPASGNNSRQPTASEAAASGADKPAGGPQEDKFGTPGRRAAAGFGASPKASSAPYHVPGAPPRRAFHPSFLHLSDLAVDAYLGEYIVGCRCRNPSGVLQHGHGVQTSSMSDGQARDETSAAAGHSHVESAGTVAIPVGPEGPSLDTSHTGAGAPSHPGHGAMGRRRSSWGDVQTVGSHVHAVRAADWGLARECALKALDLNPYDGPLKALLGVIDSMGVKDKDTGRMGPPPTWAGFRQLDSK